MPCLYLLYLLTGVKLCRSVDNLPDVSFLSKGAIIFTTFSKQAVGMTVTQFLATQIYEQRSLTRCPEMQSRALREVSTEP